MTSIEEQTEDRIRKLLQTLWDEAELRGEGEEGVVVEFVIVYETALMIDGGGSRLAVHSSTAHRYKTHGLLTEAGHMLRAYDAADDQ